MTDSCLDQENSQSLFGANPSELRVIFQSSAYLQNIVDQDKFGFEIEESKIGHSATSNQKTYQGSFVQSSQRSVSETPMSLSEANKIFDYKSMPLAPNPSPF